MQLSLADRPENTAKLARRLAAVNLTLRNPPRPGKKLLVLDIDYTLFDHRSAAERAEELMRPYLHQFLVRSRLCPSPRCSADRLALAAERACLLRAAESVVRALRHHHLERDEHAVG